MSLEALKAEGADPEGLEVHAWVDARYRGQSFELRVPAHDWAESFHEAHRERYGYRRDRTPVEAVTLRVRVAAPGWRVEPPRVKEGSGDAPFTERSVITDGSEQRARMFQRSHLGSGDRIEGPAVILEYSSTTWCPPGWAVETHGSGVLILKEA
jgi:N-methylhydantoinase A